MTSKTCILLFLWCISISTFLYTSYNLKFNDCYSILGIKPCTGLISHLVNASVLLTGFASVIFSALLMHHFEDKKMHNPNVPYTYMPIETYFEKTD